MQFDIFYYFGKVIHKYRWLIIALWVLLLLASIPYIPKLMDPFKEIGFMDPKSQSAHANTELNDHLGYTYNRFIIMYTSKKMLATSPGFLNEIKKSLSGLEDFPVKHQIIYPTVENKQIAKNKHSAYAVVLLAGKQEVAHQVLAEFKEAIAPPDDMTLLIGGEPIFLDDTKTQTQRDLFKAEYIGTPVAIITMLVVFESVVAASIPIILGGVCTFLILVTLFACAHIFSLSVFTINIALLLGLCLSLDYALLFISRYRDEISKDKHAADAIATTLATAGKAVFFSGLAVFISLSALLLFPINILFSVGIGGLASVLVAVLLSLILLPAILSVLNSKINLLPVRIFKRKKSENNTYGYWLVKKVTKNPFVFFVGTLILLLMMGFPFLHAQFGISDYRILPKALESRQVYDIISNEFGKNKLEPILVVVKTEDKNILSKKNIGQLYNFSNRISKNSTVDQITSIVNTKPRLEKSQYQTLYTDGKNHLNADLKKFLKITTKKNFTVFTILSEYPANSPHTKELIQNIREMEPGERMSLEVTGPSANTIDVKKSIMKVFPYAFLWIICFTYLTLLFLLRSLFLPLKAILTTILSLCASYGVLVLVIQQGYLHEFLNFEPQGMLDISLLIIIFCALFGISMDYEVFLLTRIKEYYEQTNDTAESIIAGVDRSSGIITSAAIIVILLCFAFMFADTLMVKAFGLGIAIAVFVDAFIIRTILVPATMTLLNSWNWYLPKWLDRILPKIQFDVEHYSRPEVKGPVNSD